MPEPRGSLRRYLYDLLRGGPSLSRASLHPTTLARSLERLVEEEFEGRLQRWFQTPLQPVEVAKAAARAMERSQVIGTSGPQVANRYDVHLHPSDFERFASFRHALTSDVERYLDEQARRLGVRPVDAWRVSLVADEAVRSGRVEVIAQMVDHAAVATGPAGESPPLEHTQRLPVGAASIAPPAAVLVVGNEEYLLAKSLTTIGRALDNDLVLSDTRVSRYHAQVHQKAGRYRIVDLATTNGTFVGGRRVTEAGLAPGDEISLGGLIVRLELRP